MDLFEFDESATLRREEAASKLRALADSLARHNNIEFRRDGIPYTVKVPDEVSFETEFEIDDDGTSLEIEISW